MKLYAPNYYKKFKCIADKCKHSCCIGWEIDIDESTLAKYSSLTSDYAKKILNSIEFSEDPHFRLLKNDRCPHLNDKGLCNIIINTGEENLCDICREHPRFYNFTNIGKEVGVGMSCEEASRLILESDDFDKIVPIGDAKGDCEIINFDSLSHREVIFKIIKHEEMDFVEKIEHICAYYDLYFDEKSILDCILKLEYLNDEHKTLFSGFNLNPPPEDIRKKVERALAYFVYRHCTEAEDFYDFSISLSFAIIFAYLISSISNKDNIEDMARIVSEEIEYSTENIELLKQLFF